MKKLDSSGIESLERESLLKATISKDRPFHFLDNNHFTIYDKQTIYVHCRKILKLFVRALKTSEKTRYHVLFHSECT